MVTKERINKRGGLWVFTSVAADSSIIFTGTTVEGDNGGTTLDNATALKVKGAANQQLELFIASV